MRLKHFIKVQDVAKKFRRQRHTYSSGKTYHYVLIWENGVYAIGEPWVLAKQYPEVSQEFFLI